MLYKLSERLDRITITRGDVFLINNSSELSGYYSFDTSHLFLSFFKLTRVSRAVFGASLWRCRLESSQQIYDIFVNILIPFAYLYAIVEVVSGFCENLT